MTDTKQWHNRIVGYANVHPSEVCPHDLNWRRHPAAQMRALKGAIDTIGFIKSVTVNQRTGNLIDGHARLKLAIETGQQMIPVEYVDLSLDEERLALATMDPLSAMAETDQAMLDDLLAGVKVNDDGLQELLNDLANQEEEAEEELVGAFPENDPVAMQVKPPPEMVWVLTGIPLTAWPAVRDHVVALQKVASIKCQSSRDGDDDPDENR